MSRYKKRSRKIARQLFWEKHDRDEYSCPDCGRLEEEVSYSFEVHHKNGEPMDNRPENHVALCRTCHNLRENKKPSMGQIQRLRNQVKKDQTDPRDDSGVPEVYLAGCMDNEGVSRSGWRSSIADKRMGGVYINNIPSSPVGFNSPTEVSFEHSGDPVRGIAKDDMSLLDSSDAIVAYFSKKEQVGTLTELVYAVSKGMPALVVFNESLVTDTPEMSNISFGVDFSFQIDVYWFLVNFLTAHISKECGGDIEISVVETIDEIKDEVIKWEWHNEASAKCFRDFHTAEFDEPPHLEEE